MTRAERRKFKYAVIRNVTKNPKLAERYKNISDKRIFDELNIIIPKKVIEDTGRFKEAEQKKAKYEVEGYVYKYNKKGTKWELRPPDLKPLDKQKQVKYERLQENKVKYAINRGIDLEDAQHLRHKTYKQIDKAIVFNKTWVKAKVKGKAKNLPDQAKIEQFTSWAKMDDFPPNFVRMARSINLRNNYDINDKFGFAVMHHAYVYNREPEHFEKQLTYNKATQLVEYKTNMKY